MTKTLVLIKKTDGERIVPSTIIASIVICGLSVLIERLCEIKSILPLLLLLFLFSFCLTRCKVLELVR